MKLPSKIRISDDVMSRNVGDEVVLLDLASGNYYGLDAVGARIWQLLGQGHAPEGIVGILLAEYEAGREQLLADTARLLGELSARGLVVVEDE